MADTTIDYPLGEDVYELMRRSRSKTICGEYDEQLDLSEKLYGQNLKFKFERNEVRTLLEKAEIYLPEERARTEQIISYQMRKYCYLFLK